MLIVSTDLLKASEERFKDAERVKAIASAAQEAEEKLGLSTKKTDALKAAGNIISPSENLDKRKKMLRATGTEPVDFAYERAIGNNDSVYSNFCELISSAKQKIGRIVIREGSENKAYATGFMVSDRLMLTNWHVFKNEEMVADSEIEFFYELDMHGRSMKQITFKLAAEDFFHAEKDLDYCFVAVSPYDITGKVSLAEIGYHYLDPTLGKLGEEGKELLNIIHHPNGDYKQLSIRENEFIRITPIAVWYKTDTAQGSSGSPVFNDQWQVVALHHMGVPGKTPDGKYYVDKDNKPILPDGNGNIDVSRVHWKANEGIRVSVILKDIFAQRGSDPLVAGLKTKPGHVSPSTKKNTLQETEKNNTVELNQSHIQVLVPTNLLQQQQGIHISINGGNKAAIAPQLNGAIQAEEDDYLLEIKKIEKEKAVDFSKCRGYSPNFLGVNIPLPKPRKVLEKQVARLKNGSFELKYFKYSVIFNAMTRMPIISAVNVEGNPALRLDDSKRKDDWLRDHRIDLDTQLVDRFYSGSGFDKGHMSRFEDANWDKTEADALRNGIYTCFHTNACPQVPDFNRKSGIWVKLEKAILEKGVKNEAGKLARVSVFNGPIFSEKQQKEKVYKGVAIPYDFFKIVLWINDDGDLKATGFKLSQKKLLKDIDWNAPMDEEEALDIDQNEVFENYQCSIKSLSAETKIDFSDLYPYDTFDDSTGKESILIESEEKLEMHLKKHSKKKRK